MAVATSTRKVSPSSQMVMGLPQLLMVISLTVCPTYAGTSAFRGEAALEKTKRTVAFGERPSGSAGIKNLREYILGELKPLGGRIELDSFQGQTPTGPIPLVNVIDRFPGTSGKAIVVTGHYDTKRIPLMTFLGANDGGSSTGFLLEFARVVAASKHQDDIYVVFFDGEEAVAEWSESDSRYGSRHLASKWLTEGLLPKLKALINVDMIGDKDLDIHNDGNSSEALRERVQVIAALLGDGKHFRNERSGGIDDDHMPFVNAGVNAIDLIDFTYGPNNAYWHQASDTMDKLSAQSFQVMGDVVLALVKQLDAGS